MAPRIRLVINPRAGSGAALRRLPEIEAALRRRDALFEVARTTGPSHATRLARAAFDDGIDVIAVVGGDGTLNEVCQAWLDDNGEPRKGPELALIPVGTGGDFRRTLGVSKAIDDAVARLCSAKSRPVDLGILKHRSMSGAPRSSAFINITSFGMGGVTDRLVNESPKWIGGKAAFYLGTARAMLVYKNVRVRVTVDDNVFVEGPIFNVAVANGRYFGGGMLIAPEASPDDGLFDVISLGDLTRAEALALSSKIYKGTHVHHPKTRVTRGALVRAETIDDKAEALIDMDGETPGKLPIEIRVAPGWLRFRS